MVVGKEFGDYRVDGVLGRNGMGVVYRAWQRRMNRAVALRVLPAELARDPHYRARLAREVAALARLDSPHVVQIYDHGSHRGRLYVATRLVEGTDLERLIEAGPLTPGRALRITDQVAAALGDGHAVGVVHRDVTPGKVLVRPRADHELSDDTAPDDVVHLADFGIARGGEERDGGERDGGEPTRDDTAPRTAETLAYLAPERFDGMPASPASDVYALGCVLWELLTGAPPYRGTRAETVSGHRFGPIPQLAGDDPRTAGVNELLRGVLAKDPAQRMSVARMRRAIRHVVPPAAATRPSSRTPTGPTSGRTSRPAPGASARPTARLTRGRPRRWPYVVAASATVVAAVAVLAVVLLDPARTAPDRVLAATPVGASCDAVAVGQAERAAGVLAAAVCPPAGDVGELRVVALRGDVGDYLRTVAGRDPSELPMGRCPDGLPAAEPWRAGSRAGTLYCVVVGTTTRYAWTVDDVDAVVVLDGAAALPHPGDVEAVARYFAAARYR